MSGCHYYGITAGNLIAITVSIIKKTWEIPHAIKPIARSYGSL